MICQIHENLHKIHDEVHIFEESMRVCAAREPNGANIEIEALSMLIEKMQDAMLPLLKDVPKYRVGLCYYSLMSAFCDLTAEDSAELNKAKQHAERTGVC